MRLLYRALAWYPDDTAVTERETVMGFIKRLTQPIKGSPNPPAYGREDRGGLADAQKRELDAINRASKKKGKRR